MHYFWRLNNQGQKTNLGAWGPSNCNGGNDIDLNDTDGVVALTYECVYGHSLFKYSGYPGNYEWYKSYPKMSDAYDIKHTNDGGYIMVGYSTTVGSGNKDAYIIKTDSSGESFTNTISGKISYDGNKNCGSSFGLLDNIIKVSSTEYNDRYTKTNYFGNYNIKVDTGTFTITHTPQEFMSLNCPLSGSHTQTFANPFSNAGNKNFYDTILFEAVILKVDIVSQRKRLCTRSKYSVTYRNLGTITAYNVQVKVELPNEIIPLSSSIPWSNQTGNTLIFDIDSMRPFSSNTIYIVDSVACNTSFINRTKCAKATIFPDTILEPLDTAWDRSSVAVNGECLNSDTIRFVIYNTGDPGTGNMSGASEYRIYRNNILITTNSFQLNGGDSLEIIIPVDSSTYRLEADQRPGHPGSSYPRVTLEGCGTGNFVPGLVNSVFQDDNDVDVSIDCQRIWGSCDPNEKVVVPNGFTAKNYIESDDHLEYSIYFQNTGNDTAYTVIIRDTLSEYLDPTTFEILTSSHDYVWDIYDNGILEFVFNNIMLVDSTTNEPESNGFVQFRIGQKDNNAPGTVIENNVGIYFDYNAPVITNKTSNTVFSCDSIANFIVNDSNLCIADTLFFEYNNGGGATSFLWKLEGDTIDTTSSSSTVLDTFGTYTITLIAGNEVCSNIISKTINVYIPPIANASNDTTICSQDSVPLSSGGGFVYSWTPVTGLSNPYIANPIADPDTITTYIVGVSTGTCVDYDTVTISVYPLLSVSTGHVSCNGGNDGSINISVLGNASPHTYQWSTGDTTEDIAGLPVGAYTITVTDTNGCVNDSTIQITQPSQLSTNIQSSSVPCTGDSSGSADLTVAGGVLPYAYNWDIGDTTEDISGLPPGTFVVTVTDSTSCIAVDSVVMPTALVLTTANTDASCAEVCDGSGIATPSGGTAPYNYNWSDPLAQTGQTAIGLCAGTFMVTVTDSAGCASTDSVPVGEPAPLALSFAITDVICPGDSSGVADLSISGGIPPYTYQWSTGDTIEDLSGLPSGIYFVIVNDSNSCSTDTLTITEPTYMNTTKIITAVSCYGGSDGIVDLTVTGGVLPYTYLWSTGDSVEDISGLVAGNYFVTITDSCGANFYDTAIINEPLILSASSTVTNVNCIGDSTGSIDLMVLGGTSPYTYNWSTGDSVEDISSFPAGNYTVAIVDSCGDLFNDTIVISEPLILSLSSVVTHVSCNGGSNGSNNLTVLGGTPPFSYLWSTGDTIEDISGLTAGSYYVTVGDSCSQTAMDTVIISEPGVLTPNFSITDVTCYGSNDGTIDLSFSGGTPPYTYNWSTGNTIVFYEDFEFPFSWSGWSTSTLSSDGGFYWGNYWDANVGGNWPVAPHTNFIMTNDDYCEDIYWYCDKSQDYLVLPVQNFNGYSDLMLSFDYVDERSMGGDPSTIEININNGGWNVLYTLPRTPWWWFINGYPWESIKVPLVGADNQSSVRIRFHYDDGGWNPWSSATGLALDNITIYHGDLSGLSPGNYILNVTDFNGCTVSDSVAVTEPLAITDSLTFINASCNGAADGLVNLTVNGGTTPYTYSWSNGSITKDISGLLAGTYSVIISDSNSCTKDDTATIDEPVAITAFMSATSVSCNGGSDGAIDLTVSNGVLPYTYTWDTGDTTEDISAIPSGSYTIVIIDSSGCTKNDTAYISEPQALATLLAPTDVSCYGAVDGAVNLSTSGGITPYTYYWSNGLTTEDITNLTAGLYYVEVTDSNGCTKNDTASVVEPMDLFSIISGTDISCNGGNDGTADLTVSGGTTPYTYLWSNGDTIEDPLTLAVGTYLVTITDTNGCSTIDGITIAQPTALTTVVMINDATCFNGNDGSASITSGGGTSPYTYAWSSGGASSVETGLSAGNYTVTATDFNGCGKTDSLVIDQPSLISTNVSDVICSNDSIFLQGNYQNTAGTYYDTLTSYKGCDSINSTVLTVVSAYTVNDTTVTICNGDSTLIYGIYRSIAGTYFDSLVTVNNCDSLRSTVLTIDSLPTVSFSGLDSSYCSTDAGVTLTGSPAGGTFTATGGLAGNQFFPATGVNTYVVTYTYTDSNNCTNSSSQNVAVTACTGIEKSDHADDVDIYPNPTTGLITISNLPKESIRISIYSALGELVQDQRLRDAAKLEIDLSPFSSGLYLIQIHYGEMIIRKKVIKE